MNPRRIACAAALAAALVLSPTLSRAETPDWGRSDPPRVEAGATPSPPSIKPPSIKPPSIKPPSIKPSPRRAGGRGQPVTARPAPVLRRGVDQAASDAGAGGRTPSPLDRRGAAGERPREAAAVDGRATARPLSQTASPLPRARLRPLPVAPAPAVADWARGRIAGAPMAPLTPAASTAAPPPAQAPPSGAAAPTTGVRPAPEGGPCEAEIARAARRWGVPTGVLHAVGLTETGRGGVLSPYALNIDGVTVFPASAEAALRRFEQARSDGAKFVDMGCMQINHRFHAAAFPSTAAMLEPARNVDYAARFLKQLRDRHGGWTLAVARYNAGPDNDPAQKRYVCTVIGQLVRSGHGAWTDSARAFCGKPR